MRPADQPRASRHRISVWRGLRSVRPVPMPEMRSRAMASITSGEITVCPRKAPKIAWTNSPGSLLLVMWFW
ncbi:hypothetical protein [Rhodovulum sp. BSW8]|uniref:hypothetical protein n=1 Tax=Rhodovulum sp. BSW8 TaxID=2259645 RepID=UPI0014036F75|nr:hypothetical protein [Rhodovulum sp. BSW8]